MTKTVVLLGKGELAVRIGTYFRDDPDYRLMGVVPVVPEPTWTESLGDWAHSSGVPVIESGHHRDIAFAEAGQFDLLFSCFYELIVPETLLLRFRQALNLHNGPLPKYRGVAPINWALKNGEREHGVTIHEMTAGIDDGPVVAQLTYSIYPEFDEVITVYGRALRYGWALFEDTMPILDRIPPRRQDDEQATYYSAADKAALGDRSDFTRTRSLGP